MGTRYTMITLEVGHPRELSHSLEMLNTMNVKHLHIHTRAHFWHTNDQLQDIKNMIGEFYNLLFIEITGDSYPSLLDITNFLGFLRSENCNIKVLKLQISPPFPGQYRIQDRTFMINKVLRLIHDCRSIVSTQFYYKNGKDDVWVRELNEKLRSILRNRVLDTQEKEELRNGDHSRL